MGTKLVVDGDYLMHRCLYLPNYRGLTTSEGQPSGVVYGTLNSLRKIIHDTFEEPVEAVYFLTAGGGYWRRKVYEGYKEKTEEERRKWREVDEDEKWSDQELYEPQRAALEEVLPDLGIRVMSYPQYEADDLSWLVAERLEENVVAVSDDYDWAQLMKLPYVALFRPQSEELVEHWNFEERFDVPPEAYPLKLSIVGGHDKIPQVQSRIGPKTTDKIIAELDEYTPMAVKKWAEDQSGLKGKLALPDRVKQLRINLKLVDLSRMPKKPGLLEYVNRKMQETVSFSQKEAQDFIRSWELSSLSDILTSRDFKRLR